MYDSNEVRDAVRNEVVTGLMRRWPPSRPTPEEAAVFHDALMAVLSEQAARQERLTAVVRQFCDAILAWAEEVGQLLLDANAAALKPAAAGLEALAEALGILDDKMERRPAPWAARPRKPEIRPVRPVDAVAAGRHPAMLFRTRHVGGRR